MKATLMVFALAVFSAAAHADVGTVTATSYQGYWEIGLNEGAHAEGTTCDAALLNETLTDEGQLKACIDAFAGPSNQITTPWAPDSFGFAICGGNVVQCTDEFFTDGEESISMFCPNGGSPNPSLGDQGTSPISGWCIKLGIAPPPSPPSCLDGSSPPSGLSTCASPPELGAGDPNKCQCSGDPINAGSGNVYYETTDFKGGFEFPLEFDRSYNSAIANQPGNPDGADNTISPGWTSNLSGPHLYININQQYFTCTYPDANDQPQDYVCPVEDSPVLITVWRPDGGQSVFGTTISSQSVIPDGPLTPVSGAQGQLSHGTLPAPLFGSGYVYLRNDGYMEFYDPTGVLLMVENPHGAEQIYQYTAGKLTSIEATSQMFYIGGGATAASTITFTYDAQGRLSTMTNPGGQPAAHGPAGTYTYSYDANGNLSQVQYPDGSQVKYVYEDAGYSHALTGVIDENGNRYATWGYDAQGRANSSYNGNGTSIANDVSIAYNSDGSVDITEATGLVRHMTFQTINGANYMASVSAPCPQCHDDSQTISYDTNGRPVQKTDFNGNVTTYSYDGAGHQLTRTDAYGTPAQRTVTTVWNPAVGLPEQITKSNASGQSVRVTTYCYNFVSGSCADSSAAGTVWKVTDADPINSMSRTATYTYKSPDSSLSPVGGAGFLTGIQGTRTNMGIGYEVESQSFVGNAIGQEYNATFDQNGMLEGLTQWDPTPMNQEDNLPAPGPTFGYDLRQRVTHTTIPSLDYATHAFTYDLAGNLTRVTLMTGGYYQYGYDTAHRLTSITDSNGGKIVYTLDAVGNRIDTKIFNATGAQVLDRQRVYDDMNHLIQTIGGMGQTTSYLNDPDGNPYQVTDPNGNSRLLVYDALNQLANVTDPNQGNTVFTHDTLGRVDNVTTPRGLNTTYTYDAYGEVLSATNPDSGTTTYTYDAVGNIASKTTGDGTANYSYDGLNRVTQITYPSAPSQNVSFFYDHYNINAECGMSVAGMRHTGTDGHLVCMEDRSGVTIYSKYDGFGRVLTKSAALGASVNYQYDAGENLTGIQLSVSQANGGALEQYITYIRDPLGNITQINAQNDTNAPYAIVKNVCYMPFGPVCGLTYGNGLKETRGFDQDYRLISINTPGVQVWGLGYDADDNLTSMTDGVSVNGGKNFTQTWTYDALNRITANGPLPISYGYDADGNRISAIDKNGKAYTYTYANDSEHILSSQSGSTSLSTYTYDGAGAITSDGAHNFIYWQSGRLAIPTNPSTGARFATYYVNGFGQRVQKTVGTTSTYFIYDESGHLIADLSSTSINHVYVWMDERPVAYFGAGGITATRSGAIDIHVDQINTPRYLTNSSGTVGWEWPADPFNGRRPSAFSFGSDFMLGLPGQYYDSETGKNYNYFREYDVSIGRYLESDPLGLAGGINTYIYVNDDPVGLADPLGLCGKNPQDPGTIPGTTQYIHNCINKFLTGNYGNYLGQYIIPDSSILPSAADIGGGAAEGKIANKIANTLNTNGYLDLGWALHDLTEIVQRGSEPNDIYQGALAVMATVAQGIANFGCTGAL